MTAIARVYAENGNFVVQSEYADLHRVKGAPSHQWDPKGKLWILPAVMPNSVYIETMYTDDEVEPSARKLIKEIRKNQDAVLLNRFPTWYKFKGTPMEHQVQALNKAWGQDSFAFFMEMRTGKTFTSINLAAAYAMAGDINAILVFCPTPVKFVWEDEMAKFCPIEHKVFVFESGSNKAAKRFIEEDYENLKVMIFGIEAMSQGGAAGYAASFARCHNTMAVVDESSRIKNFKASRTDKIIGIGAECSKRVILTGTPITQGMHDMYSQYRFLDWKILGQKSFYTFRNRYCVMGGFEGRQITGYTNVKELLGLVEPYTYVVRSADCWDLPDKIYERRVIKPTKEQLKAMDDLANEFVAIQGDDELPVETVLERMVRYQQIAGGSFPYLAEEIYKESAPVERVWKVKPIEGRNPKVDELLEVLDEIDGKVIIWAKFRPEIDAIVAALTKKYGSQSILEFHGGVEESDRNENARRFQTDDRARFFVTNQQTGSMGINLSAASTHIFFSNSFSYEERVQAEARTNSADQKAKSILYLDLVLDHKIDKRIQQAIESKTSVAEFVNRELKKGSKII